MDRKSAWTILQHVPHEGPGLIGGIGAERGLTFSTVRLDRGEPLPPAAGIGGLVILGGPMGVYEADLHPHISAEIDLIRECLRLGRPVLGVCLGSQILAAALGARVYKGPGPEIGAGEVELTPPGIADPVLGGAGPRIPVFHWHGDTFDLPPGGVHLARSGRYPHQAFRFGEKAYAFQFHVEVDAGLARAWAPHLPEGVKFDEGHRRAIEASGRGIIGRFFAAAGHPMQE